LDAATETTILERLKTEFAERSLICSLHRARLASAFDRVLVMEHGHLVAQGSYAELQKPGSLLEPLMAAAYAGRQRHRFRISGLAGWAAGLVSGIRTQTGRGAQKPMAARLRKAAMPPKWSATSPAAVVLSVAPPPIASPTTPRKVV